MEEVFKISIEDARYPELLKHIYNAPESLYVRGSFPDFQQETAISVIGTRRASPYGLKMARRLGYEIAKCGAWIVTGIGSEIDSAAAEGAIQAGGKVIAVLGTPVENPKSVLAEKISENGALISEYPKGTVPQKAFFKMRNRIAAGISVGVVVVEAPEHSGTRLFVTEALNQGKDIFAVPGNADSEMSSGTIRLIKEGAKMVTHGWEVAEEYPWRLHPVLCEDYRTESAVPPVRQPKKNIVDKKNAGRYIDVTVIPKDLSESEVLIYKAVSDGCRSTDEIVAKTGLPVSAVSGKLTMLQIKGLINKVPTGLTIIRK